MSTTPNTAGKDDLNESRNTVTPKATNPARPSKFAGLNLRQRSSEPSSDQPAGEAEPVQPLQAPTREREQHTASTEGGPAQAQEGPSTAPNSRGAHSVSSGPMTGAIDTSASPPVQVGDTDQPARGSESRQHSATSTPATGAQGVTHAFPDTAAKEQAPTRHRGKRTNPDYVQVTAYVRQETYRRARIKLLESTKPQEFSEVVEDLLTRWLRSGS